MKTSMEQVALELAAGRIVVLQRVPPQLTALAAMEELAQYTGQPAPVRLIDARGWLEDRFIGWDIRRAVLASEASPLVVLLDVLATRSILTAAPQTCSWAGGVRMPVEKVVRLARSPSEIALGKTRLSEWMDAEPGWKTHLGEPVAIDLGSGRVFWGRELASPLAVAREYLDEGIVYMTRVLI